MEPIENTNSSENQKTIYKKRTSHCCLNSTSYSFEKELRNFVETTIVTRDDVFSALSDLENIAKATKQKQILLTN